MASITDPTVDVISDQLGSDAEDLLGHRCETIDRSLLHLPGPDFIERVCLDSDRSTASLRSLRQMFDHGRLAGTGYLSILPVDQGIEHSAPAPASPRTRRTSIRRRSSSWRSRAAATPWPRRSACWAPSRAGTPTRFRSSSSSTTTSF